MFKIVTDLPVVSGEEENGVTEVQVGVKPKVFIRGRGLKVESKEARVQIWGFDNEFTDEILISARQEYGVPTGVGWLCLDSYGREYSDTEVTWLASWTEITMEDTV